MVSSRAHVVNHQYYNPTSRARTKAARQYYMAEMRPRHWCEYETENRANTGVKKMNESFRRMCVVCSHADEQELIAPGTIMKAVDRCDICVIYRSQLNRTI